MIPADLLNLLRCPASGQTVAMADAEVLARLNERISQTSASEAPVRNAAGVAVEQTLTEALLRLDRLVLYPVSDGIPVLLAEEAISL